MTPAALIVLGAFAYFMFRLRFAFLSIVWDWTVRRAAMEEARRKAERRRPRSDVGFYTVDQVWGEEEKEKKSA